jgi:hypothetical protein
MATKLPPEFREYLSKIGQKGGLKGGKSRAARLSPEQRSESARNAVRSRWAKLGLLRQSDEVIMAMKAKPQEFPLAASATATSGSISRSRRRGHPKS